MSVHRESSSRLLHNGIASFVDAPERDLRSREETIRELRAEWLKNADPNADISPLLTQRGLLRVGTFGAGVGGAFASKLIAGIHKVPERSAMVINFGANYGGQAQGLIHDPAHFSGREGGGTRDIVKSLSTPLVFPIPGMFDAQNIEPYVKKYGLHGVVMATGGAERLNSKLDYSIQGVHSLRRRYLTAFQNGFDHGVKPRDQMLSSRGELPKNIVFEGLGLATQDALADFALANGDEALVRTGHPLAAQTNPRRLFSTPKSGVTGRVSDNQKLRLNLESLGIGLPKDAQALLVYRNTPQASSMEKVESAMLKKAEELAQGNAWAKKRIEVLTRENPRASREDILAKFVREHVAEFKRGANESLGDLLGGYGASILTNHSIIGVHKRADDLLDVTVKNAVTGQERTLRGRDAVVTSLGTMPTKLPDVSVPAVQIGLETGSGSMQATIKMATATIPEFMDKVVAHADATGVPTTEANLAIVEQIRRDQAEAGFDGDLLAKVINEAPPEFIKNWRRGGKHISLAEIPKEPSKPKRPIRTLTELQTAIDDDGLVRAQEAKPILVSLLRANAVSLRGVRDAGVKGMIAYAREMSADDVKIERDHNNGFAFTMRTPNGDVRLPVRMNALGALEVRTPTGEWKVTASTLNIGRAVSRAVGLPVARAFRPDKEIIRNLLYKPHKFDTQESIRSLVSRAVPHHTKRRERVIETIIKSLGVTNAGEVLLYVDGVRPHEAKMLRTDTQLRDGIHRMIQTGKRIETPAKRVANVFQKFGAEIRGVGETETAKDAAAVLVGGIIGAVTSGSPELWAAAIISLGLLPMTKPVVQHVAMRQPQGSPARKALDRTLSMMPHAWKMSLGAIGGGGIAVAYHAQVVGGVEHIEAHHAIGKQISSDFLTRHLDASVSPLVAPETVVAPSPSVPQSVTITAPQETLMSALQKVNLHGSEAEVQSQLASVHTKFNPAGPDWVNPDPISNTNSHHVTESDWFSAMVRKFPNRINDPAFIAKLQNGMAASSWDKFMSMLRGR